VATDRQVRKRIDQAWTATTSGHAILITVPVGKSLVCSPALTKLVLAFLKAFLTKLCAINAAAQPRWINVGRRIIPDVCVRVDPAGESDRIGSDSKYLPVYGS
jgi:hypothetical protein